MFTFRKNRLPGALLLLLPCLCPAVDVRERLAQGPPRFSTNYMNLSAAPGENFYEFANGAWLQTTEVPADKSRWAGFDELRERNWILLRQILEAARTGSADGSDSARAKVGRFYQAATDTNRLEKLKWIPIEPDLARIRGINSVEDLIKVAGLFHRRGISCLFASGAPADDKNSDRYAFYLSQGGLTLPTREYYLDEKFESIRQRYLDHLKAMFVLAGDVSGTAGSNASLVFGIERQLAEASKNPVELRDRLANYHKIELPDLRALAPSIPFEKYLEALGASGVGSAVVGQPKFFERLDALLKEHPLEHWKAYLRWHLLDESSPFLHEAAVKEHYFFHETVLGGNPEMEPLWQRAARTIDGALGEALGEIFVERYFPPQAKQRALQMIDHIKETFRARLERLDWMTETTRKRALEKFDSFRVKIGYPDKFRDYSSVTIQPDDYLGNVWRANEFEFQRRIVRINKPVDRSEWGMTPPTVNADFRSTGNEIVFPAGILQPPFFDSEADDAVNYGAIGVVIGHEITHGFDDQGRRYDAKGNLNDWWSEADAAQFKGRSQKVVDQFNAYEALPGLFVNGQLCLGENIADLGGVSIAHEAFKRSMAGKKNAAEKRDGFTPEQRFFLAHAQLWRVKWRPEALRRQVTVDPHSPGQFRAIGPLVNLEEFYRAFDIPATASLYRQPKERAKIW